VRGEVTLVGGKQCRQIGAGRVADDEHSSGVAAILSDVLLDPRERGRRIADVNRMCDRGRQAIVDHCGDKTG
jgi:hypothetical protein